MRRSGRRAAAAACAILVCGCGPRSDDPGPEAGPIVVDTLGSGRIVVESRAPGWGEDEGWRLERRTTITVGADAGPVPTRVVDVALGPDGRILVLDAGRSEVRTFSPSGELLGTVGGPRGDTVPLVEPYAMAVDPRGRLWVGDGATRTYVTFDTEGRVVGAMASPLLRGHLDGQLRLSGTQLFDFGFLMSTGRIREPGDSMTALGPGLVAFALDRALAPSDTIVVAGRGPGPAIPHSPRWVGDVGPRGEIWVGHGDRPVFYRLDASGDTLRTVAWDDDAIPLDSIDALALEGWRVNQSDDVAAIEPMVLPRHYPYFERIIAAEDGTVWLFRRTSSAGGRFEVFDSEGRRAGAIDTDLGAGFEGVHPFIARDRVVGVVFDEAGATSVVVDLIVRPPVP